MRQKIKQVWDGFSLRTKGLIMVAAPLFVLLVPMALLFFNLQQRSKAQEWVNHTLQVRGQLQLLSATMSAAESEVRGYRITGDENFRRAFSRTRKQLVEYLSQTEPLILDNAGQIKRFDKLKPIFKRRLQIMDAVAATPFSRGNQQEEVRVLMLEGARMTSQLRAGLKEMQNEEDELFLQRSQRFEQVRDRSQILMLILIGLGVGSTLLAVSVFTGDLLKRVQIIERNARLLADGWQLEPHSLGSDELGRLESAIESTSALLNANIRELHTSRRRLQGLFDSIPDVLAFADNDGRYLDINPAVESLVGFSRDELIGQPAELLAPLDPGKNWPQLWQEFLDTGSLSAEYTVARKDGTSVDVEYCGVANIEPGVHLGVLRDVTARNQAQAALRISEQRYRSLVDATTAIVWNTPASGEFEQPQPRWSAFTGQSWEDLRGWGWLDAVHPEDRAHTAQVWSGAVASRKMYEVEHRLRRHDGHYRHMIARAVPLLENEGEIWEWIGIHTDITLQKENEVALQDSTLAAEHARQDAERANRAKSEFLSRMSHELRTPLNAILGFGQLLELEELPEEQRESVEQILQAGRHLLSLINEVLDIARIEEGRLSISPEPVSVQEVVHEVISLIQPLALEVDVQIHNQTLEHNDYYVLADRQRLKQVLLNLAANAVKYNMRGGEVFLSCGAAKAKQHAGNEDHLPGENSAGIISVAEDGNEVETVDENQSYDSRSQLLRISVRDTGVGISEAGIAKLFAPFERLDDEHPEVEGTGLGLALSKRLTEIMHGAIGVESTAGGGSTFWIELPFLEEHSAVPESYVAASSPNQSTLQTTGKTVLYIEDNLSNLRLIECILQGENGIQLLSSMQGRLGFELARQHLPDLVLLDLHLPDIDGAEVLRLLLADPLTKHIPVVVISADATERQVERLLEQGAKAYLTKPLDVKQFVQVLAENLQGHTFAT